MIQEDLTYRYMVNAWDIDIQVHFSPTFSHF